MKFSESAAKRSKPSVLLTASIISGLILIVIAGGYYLLTYKQVNYAEELARPFDKALVDAGSVKGCVNGSSGRGLDNREPWASAAYDVPLDQEKTKSLIYNIANAQGYSLKHASLKDKGPIAVSDELVDKWYYDSKTSTYKDLMNGNVQLSIAIDNASSIYKCGNVDSSHTVVVIRVKLPSFK